jgi:hypothetical protein
VNGDPPRPARRISPLESINDYGKERDLFMNPIRATFNFLYEIVLGCSHQHMTRPFTLQQQTYMVCLDCGKRVYYSASAMRPLSVREIRRMHAAHAGEVRVMPPSVGAPSLVPAQARKSNAA